MVFELSENNNLEFCLKRDSILLPKLRIGTGDRLLIDVVDGHVLQQDLQIMLDYRPGKVRVDDSSLHEHIPKWALPIVASDSGINLGNQPLLDLEAISPGILRVQGVWVSQDFIYPGLIRPLTFIGEGDGTKSVLFLASSAILFGLKESIIGTASGQPRLQSLTL